MNPKNNFSENLKLLITSIADELNSTENKAKRENTSSKELQSYEEKIIPSEIPLSEYNRAREEIAAAFLEFARVATHQTLPLESKEAKILSEAIKSISHRLINIDSLTAVIKNLEHSIWVDDNLRNSGGGYLISSSSRLFKSDSDSSNSLDS